MHLDPRLKGWFLMDKIEVIIIIQLIYVFCTKILGPKLMKDKEPFNINKLLIAYNIAQILINAYLFYTVN